MKKKYIVAKSISGIQLIPYIKSTYHYMAVGVISPGGRGTLIHYLYGYMPPIGNGVVILKLLF